MLIKTIGIIANPEKKPALVHLRELMRWLKEKDIEVFLEKEVACMIGIGTGWEISALALRSDLLVVFGGDGTLLRTARFAKESSRPILGINLGGFGYLTEVNLNEMKGAMESILEGRFRTERRMMLDVTISNEKDQTVHSVLNDVVINRGNMSRIIELETSLDGKFLTTYKADGLIVSTPTGSTAYSLSAGGPIVFPQQDSIILNPICPHTLTNRPVILPEGVLVSVTLLAEEGGATLTLDGQVSFDLKPGDRVDICKSRFFTTLVSSPHRDYLEILRSKLGWGGVSRSKPALREDDLSFDV